MVKRASANPPNTARLWQDLPNDMNPGRLGCRQESSFWRKESAARTRQGLCAGLALSHHESINARIILSLHTFFHLHGRLITKDPKSYQINVSDRFEGSRWILSAPPDGLTCTFSA
ncbi:hypothetical protein QQP08_021852 [Theobroma cacao]|uniref:Uncharacterized protein n=1 Tax=Theobroma cacao TaxID=3641 RepID=A0A061F481_THECC|nr:Uncharacterized protein TCM_030517 [Theobroma cacao]WRX29365.1 hypothetical protein QQP08_021852 [Theobroma cacao]